MWTAATGSVFTGLGNYGRAIDWNGEKWVAAGKDINSDNLKYSYDGITWYSGTGGFSTIGNGVAWNGNKWLSVGENTGGDWPSIKSSTDGINWIASSPTSVFEGGQGRAVAWNGTRWIAVGKNNNTNDTIYYSEDGENWTASTNDFGDFGYGIASNGNMSIALGQDAGGNNIKYSYNGITWLNATGGLSGLFDFAYDAYWNGEIWVSCGLDGNNTYNTIKWSNDGIDWKNATTGSFQTYAYSVTWNGSQWFCGGEVSGGTTIKVSSDGKTWYSSSTGQLSTITYGLGTTNDIKGNMIRNLTLPTPLSVSTEDTLTVVAPPFYDKATLSGSITLSS